MGTYSVTATSHPGGTAQAVAFEQRIPFDAGASRDLVHAGPAELLCASLAACLLKNVERFSQLLPFRYEAARVVVEAERQDTPPRFTRFTYELQLVTDEAPRRVDLLHRNVRQHGTVSSTLGLAAPVTGELVVVASLDA